MELVPLSDAALAQAVAWHRQVAAMVEAADRAGVAMDDLPALRASLAAQAVQLGQAASRLGAPLPALMPSPAEVAAAAGFLGDLSTPSVAAATRTMRTTLAAVDAALTGAPATPPVPAQSAAAAALPPLPTPAPPPPTRDVAAAPVITAEPPPRSVASRNAAVYGAYTAAVLLVQAILFVLLDESSLPSAAPLCLLILPAFAWAAGWLTIGAGFDPAPDGTLERSPRLGVLVCLIPDALLVAAVLVLFVVRGLG